MEGGAGGMACPPCGYPTRLNGLQGTAGMPGTKDDVLMKSFHMPKHTPAGKGLAGR